MYDIRRVEELLAKMEHDKKDSELRKIRNEVFDAFTLRALYKLMEKGYISFLSSIISTGKEANVFRAEDESGNTLAVKIYRTETSEFIHLRKYIEGDPRFMRIKKERRFLIKMWTKKEFKNLETAFKHGVSVPYPITHLENIIIMEYIGDNGPSPLLKNITVPKVFYNDLLDNVAKLYFSAGLVHADLSEYNVLVRGDKPVIIDMGQSVPWEHPLAHEFFLRDMERLRKILAPFKEYGLKELIDELKTRSGRY